MSSPRVFSYLGAGTRRRDRARPFPTVVDMRDALFRPPGPTNTLRSRAGFTGSFLYNNLESFQNVAADFLRALSQRAPEAAGAVALASASGADAHRNLLLELARKVDRIAAAGRLPPTPGGGIHVFAGQSPGGVWTTLLVPIAGGCGLCLVYNRLTGRTWDDWAYVSRASFSRGLRRVGAGLVHLGDALKNLKRHIDARVDHLARDLAAAVDAAEKTRDEMAAARADISAVGEDVRRLRIVAADVERKIDEVVAAHDVTNRGVRLLCSAFDDATCRAEDEGRRRAEIRRAIDPKTRAIDANANGSTRRLPSSEKMSDVREAIVAYLREDGGPCVGDDAGPTMDAVEAKIRDVARRCEW
jgi:hypothetical protein